MKRYFYFAARFSKHGVTGFSAGIQETSDGCFDFINAAKFISEKENADFNKIVITFWAETNSVMMDRFEKIARC